jgi:hypothetical protein
MFSWSSSLVFLPSAPVLVWLTAGLAEEDQAFVRRALQLVTVKGKK